MINTKIALSLASIATAGALVAGATFALFTDTETSTGNTFEAGSLDLKVDSDCHYFQNGAEVQDGCDGFGNWEQTDLGSEKFFNFTDIKPGDWGEDTISLHVVDNDAWGKFVIDSIDETDGDADGEALRQNMEFWVWVDQGTTDGFQCDEIEGPACGDDEKEGDNVWQQNEPIIIAPGDVDANGETWNIWEGLAATQDINGGDTNGVVDDGRMVGSTTYYFGLGWCFGEAEPTAVALADVCDGSGVGNEAQGDSLSGNLSFLVVQHRNNPTQDGF